MPKDIERLELKRKSLHEKSNSFMMSIKFVSIFVVKNGKNRQLARPLKPVQHEYLRAMGCFP
jgi:hypothetical protein